MVDTPSRVPRCYYVVLPLLLLSCAGLSIGLSYAPCYSSECVEAFFPYTARVHIAVFYTLIAGIGLALTARASSQSTRQLFEYHLSTRCVPGTDSRVSIGGIALFVLIAGPTLGSTGYWLPAENAFWAARSAASGWSDSNFRLVWTAVTGHWCDILIGLVLIPVGRNSILARALSVHSYTLLRVHQLLAYALLVGGLIHGFLYYSFLGAWIAKLDSSDTPPELQETIFLAYSPDNPTLTRAETEAKGVYAWFNLPTGAIAGLIAIPIMVITALPVLRRRHYNAFYFTHITLAIVIIVAVCLHASTNFYFLLPGLVLWVGDWIWRFRHGLGHQVTANISSAGVGWYRLTIAKSPTESQEDDDDAEKQLSKATIIPLQQLYVNIGQISKLQGHPFTVAAATPKEYHLLFRCSPERKKAKSRDKEWTWQLAALAGECPLKQGTILSARIEGPYIPRVDALYTADHVLAVAGGTGITGALSIANWWIENHGPESAKSMTLLWSVRTRDVATLDEMHALQERVATRPNMQIRVHVSSEGGRLDMSHELSSFLAPVFAHSNARAWVYASGPKAMLADMQGICIEQQRLLQKNTSSSLEWHLTHY